MQIGTQKKIDSPKMKRINEAKISECRRSIVNNWRHACIYNQAIVALG